MTDSTYDVDAGPGRVCPVDYRYAPSTLDRPADLNAETLYVIGGLYGNPFALDAVLSLRDTEQGSPLLVFNGDFNWFNVGASEFARINESVLAHAATRGNVETELARSNAQAGCGCAYPEWVEDDVVEHSNAIMLRLRLAADAHPSLTGRLAGLPMYAVADVGGVRIAVVHGDAESLAGWGFSQEALRDSARLAAVAGHFAEARVRVFACTHTCLPVCQTLQLPCGPCVVINNGAAGMPNFRDTRFGLVTRISVRPPDEGMSLFGAVVDGVHVDALAVRYDHDAWCAAFVALWPPGSPGYVSYYDRLVNGPDFTLAQAVRGDDVTRQPALARGVRRTPGRTL
ncbi:MAG: hypothetical protein R3286_09635 [Gammaproteobacteria bacterium]|nr:hypothetical protein [Gammaproteobacteria bacterium]